jgi:hypothetical protein
MIGATLSITISSEAPSAPTEAQLLTSVPFKYEPKAHSGLPALIKLKDTNMYDLHYPFTPADYLGQKRMNTCTLPNGNVIPNGEKGVETDPLQPAILTKLALPTITGSAKTLTSLQNFRKESVLLRPEDRYLHLGFNSDWFRQYPHAWQGAAREYHFYFSQAVTHPKNGQIIPSVLIGIEQCWTMGNPLANKPHSDDGSLKHAKDNKHTQNVLTSTKVDPIIRSYGITPSSSHGRKLQSNIGVCTFKLNNFDGISVVDVTSTQFGITSIRFVTQTGITSPLFYNKDGPQGISDEVQMYTQLLHIKGFEHQTVQLLAEDSAAVLTYFSTYSRPIPDVALKSVLNSSHDEQYVQITETIGALRPWSTHPVEQIELTTKTDVYYTASGLAAINLHDLGESNNLGDSGVETSRVGLIPLEIEDIQANNATNVVIPVDESEQESSPITLAQVTDAEAIVNRGNKTALRQMPKVFFFNFVTTLCWAIIIMIYALGLSQRVIGPTPCQGYKVKSDLMFVSMGINYLFAAFNGIGWIWSTVVKFTGCIQISDQQRPKQVYRIAAIGYIVLNLIFCCVGMAHCFQIQFGCINYAERWALFCIYLFGIISSVTMPIFLLISSGDDYWWMNAIIPGWLVLLSVVLGYGAPAKAFAKCN